MKKIVTTTYVDSKGAGLIEIDEPGKFRVCPYECDAAKLAELRDAINDAIRLFPASPKPADNSKPSEAEAFAENCHAAARNEPMPY